MSETTNYMTIAVSYAAGHEQPLSARAIAVEAIEAASDTSKLRVTFRNNQSIPDVLSDSLQEEVLRKILDFEEVEGLLSIPDYCFSCDEFSLRRLSVFGSDRDNGKTVVTLRWSKVSGSVHAVLKLRPEFLLPPPPENARLAFQVLDCVLQPVFDLTRTDWKSAETGEYPEEIKALIDDFVTKRDELEKYAAMLKIYLEREALARTSLGGEGAEASLSGLNKQKYLC